MQITKVKLGVMAASVPVLVALALILLPLVDYVFWACGQLILSPGIPRDPSGPSTVLDFLGKNAGYTVLGIVLSFVGFPVLTECVKNVKREEHDRALLIDELKAHNQHNSSAPGDEYHLSIRELIYRINNIHASFGQFTSVERLLCFKCGLSISARQNEDFHGSCADCYFIARGWIAYGKAIGISGIAIIAGIIAITAALLWFWWVVLGLAAFATGTFAWGHYLKESKSRVK